MSARYDAYVDAGTQWLNQIPAHWQVARLDHLAETWTSNVDKHTVEGQPSVRLCNYTDVYKNHAIVEGMDFMRATATPEQIARFRLRRGDTIITKDSETAADIGIPAYVEYEAEDLVCGYHLAMIRPDLNVTDPRFLYWALSARPTLRQWEVLASGVTRVGIRSGDLARATIAVPALAEQRAIADFLDRETDRIEALVKEQDGLVETLRERRAALISHTVQTSTPVRVPLRRIADVIDCAHVTAEFVDDDQRFPVASIRECSGDQVDLSSCRYTTAEFFVHLRAGGRTPRVGDLLFIRNVSVGQVAAVAPGTPDFAVGQETVLLRRKKDMNPAFLRYALTASEATQAIQRAMIGSTFKRINVAAIRGLPVPLPSIEEQDRIADYLDDQTKKIDALIAEAEGIVAVAKERRSALIAAAVTGQIDVRGEVA